MLPLIKANVRDKYAHLKCIVQDDNENENADNALNCALVAAAYDVTINKKMLNTYLTDTFN